MLTLLDKDGPYQLPTGWYEISTRQYLEVDAAGFRTMEQRASYFASRPIQVNAYVAEVLGFMLHPVPTEGGLSCPQDLGQETYLQVETIRGLLAHPLHQVFGGVYGTFVAREQQRQAGKPAQHFDQVVAARLSAACLDLSVTDTLPAVAHCLAELQRLGEKYAELGLPDTTEAGRRAREAGSERLAMFSHLNVARYYAERFGTSIGDIYQRPWEEIALYLYQDRLNAEVLDNLQRQSHDSK